MAEEYISGVVCPVEKSGHNIGDAVVKERPCKLSYSMSMDIKVADLKNSLDAWREILLPVNAILHWEKQWHPLSIVGGTTTFFMMIWLLDPSILTTFSLIGLTLTLSDYLVPHLAASLLKTEQWTDNQEQKYDHICKSIVITQEKISLTFRSFCLMRTTRPRLYYGISIVTLLFLAWIGNTINNLFLTYVIVTFLSLMPGMESRGILQKYGLLITGKIADLATNAKLNVADQKKNK